jgi:hypothetical protein
MRVAAAAEVADGDMNEGTVVLEDVNECVVRSCHRVHVDIVYIKRRVRSERERERSEASVPCKYSEAHGGCWERTSG